MKNFIQKILGSFGYYIQSSTGLTSLDGAFKQLQALNIRPEVVVDGGASSGIWSKVARRYFPNAHYILIEPLFEHWPSLEQMPNSEVVRGALSDTAGTKTLHVAGPGYSSLKPSDVADKRTVEAYPANQFLFSANTLLKIDLDGQELVVLEPANLANVVAVVIEVTPTALPAISQMLEGRGFICSNVFNLNYGPKGVLAQFDALFIRQEVATRSRH